MELRGPIDMVIDVTDNCNLNCAYCYAQPKIKPSELPSNQVKDIIDRVMTEIEPFEVTLSGGEPFLRPDFIDIAKYIVNNYKTEVNTVTNGTLLNKTLAKEIKKLQTEYNFDIQLSMDSHIPEIHNCVRGEYEKSIQGLEVLLSENVNVLLSMVIHKQNVNTILESIDFFYNKGIRRIHLMNAMPSERYIKNSDLLEIEDKKVLVDRWKELVKINKDNLALYTPYLLGKEKLRAYYPPPQKKGDNNIYNVGGCLAGTTRAHILANGDIISCGIIRKIVLGNILKDSWEDIWKSQTARDIRSLDHQLCLDNYK